MSNLTFEKLRETVESMSLRVELDRVKGNKPDYLIELDGKFYQFQFPYRRDPEFMQRECRGEEDRQWPKDWRPSYPRYSWLVTDQTRWELMRFEARDRPNHMTQAFALAYMGATNTIYGITVLALTEAERRAFLAEVLGRMSQSKTAEDYQVFRPSEDGRDYQKAIMGYWHTKSVAPHYARLVISCEATGWTTKKRKRFKPRPPLSRRQRLRCTRLQRRRQP